MINMLTAIVEKVDSIQEHMGNVSREIEVLRESERKVGIQNRCNREECFWWAYRYTEHGWGKTPELEDLLIENSKRDHKEEKKNTAKNEIEYPRTVEQIQMHFIHIMRKPREGREKGKEGKLEAIMMESFHKLILDTKL